MQLISKHIYDRAITLSPILLNQVGKILFNANVGKDVEKHTLIEWIVMVFLAVPIVILSMHILQMSNFQIFTLAEGIGTWAQRHVY